MSKLKIISLTILIFTVQYLISETALIDSLERELKKAKGENRYEVLHKLGWQYHNISFEKAFEYEDKAMIMAKEWGDSLRVARSLYQLARIYMNRDFEESLKAAERSIEMIEELDKRKITKYYRNLGYIYESNYKLLKAKEAYLKALDSAKELEFRAYVLQDILNIQMVIGEYNDALENSIKRLEIWEKIDNKYMISYSLLDVGRIFWFLCNYDEALKYYFLSMKTINTLDKDYFFEKAMIYENLGNTYNSVGNYYLAMLYLKKSIYISKNLKDYSIEYYNYELLGIIYDYLGEYNKAYYYSYKSLMKGIDLKKIGKVGRNFKSLGQILLSSRKYKLALKCFNMAELILKKIKDARFLSIVYLEMGEYFYDLGNYSEANKYLEKSYIIKYYIGDRQGLSYVLNRIAKINIMVGNENEALDKLNEAIKLSSEIKDNEMLKQIYLTYSEYNEYINQNLESLKYLKLYDTIQDSIFSIDRLNAITQMDIEIKNLERQKELDLLEQKNDVISAELEQEKYTRIKLIVLVSSLILLIISFILYSCSLKSFNTRLEKEIKIRKSSELELRELKAGLEEQVAKRTAQLRKVNDDLLNKINEKIYSEKKLLEIEKMAGIGQIAAGMAHEIRNPIAIIRSTAQYLSDNYKLATSSMLKLTENSDIINDIISRLMNFARLKPLELQNISLKDVLLDLHAKFQHQLLQKGIFFRMNLPPKIPLVKLDPALFSIMISNIITNSLEELQKDGEICLNVKKDKNLLEIIITDNGRGIENIDLAMRSFFTTKKGRAGLGFNFAEHIAGIHNFIFKLQSKIDKGTEARIIILRS